MKILISVFLTLGVILTAATVSAAVTLPETNPQETVFSILPEITNPQLLLCEALSGITLGCLNATTSATTEAVNPISTLFPSLFGLGGSPSQKIRNKTVVQEKETGAIYQIINGKKHLIPTPDIFEDYGFKSEKVVSVSSDQLLSYPRASLVKIKGKKTIYYITETNLKREIIDNDSLASYGKEKGDAINISKKELEFYSSNEYIYQLEPYNPDIFKIEGKTKRYLTPIAVQRLNIQNYQVAPVSPKEFEAYKIGKPIIE